MLQTTLGQLLVNEALPEELRDYTRVLDKSGTKKLLQQVAEKYPDRYREIAKKLSDLGHTASFTTGGYSVGVKALQQSLAGRKMRFELGKKLNEIYDDRNLSEEAREEKILEAVTEQQGKLADAVMEESLAEQNPLALQVLSGARGNKVNVNSLRGADLLYTDHRGKVLPIPVTRNYSMGLRPHEYFAGAFGARKGIMDLKSATQDAGFFAKQLVQASHRLLVSRDDDEKPYDPSNPRGLSVDTDDPDNEGAVLAHPVGGYERNTVLSPKILKELRAAGHDQILVRSPTVGGPEDGGVYAKDLGYRERGGFAPIGEYAGITAAQALAEPVTQAQISSKHSGGVAGAGAGAISGFKHINSLVQVPRVFPGGAAHAQNDGRVSEVRKAPQGGHYVTVGDKKHYVGQDFEVKVKPGDMIEAGDVLSEGTPNPAEIVKHKGIGEGKKYFVQTFRKALTDSNTYGNRRNIELLARGLINHVRLTDEMGDWSPDDVIPYQALEAKWQPRPGYTVVPPKNAQGKYLERPVLHYSVGTRIQPSMLKNFERYGVENIHVHDEPPPFEPEMIRGMANVAHDPDWMTRMLGSYQKGSLLSGVHQGAVSDTGGTSYVPALAAGTGFAREGLTQGWKSPAQSVLQPPTPKPPTPRG